MANRSTRRWFSLLLGVAAVVFGCSQPGASAEDELPDPSRFGLATIEECLDKEPGGGGAGFSLDGWFCSGDVGVGVQLVRADTPQEDFFRAGTVLFAVFTLDRYGFVNEADQAVVSVSNAKVGTRFDDENSIRIGFDGVTYGSLLSMLVGVGVDWPVGAELCDQSVRWAAQQPDVEVEDASVLCSLGTPEMDQELVEELAQGRKQALGRPETAIDVIALAYNESSEASDLISPSALETLSSLVSRGYFEVYSPRCEPAEVGVFCTATAGAGQNYVLGMTESGGKWMLSSFDMVWVESGLSVLDPEVGEDPGTVGNLIVNILNDNDSLERCDLYGCPGIHADRSEQLDAALLAGEWTIVADSCNSTGCVAHSGDGTEWTVTLETPGEQVWISAMVLNNSEPGEAEQTLAGAGSGVVEEFFAEFLKAMAEGEGGAGYADSSALADVQLFSPQDYRAAAALSSEGERCSAENGARWRCGVVLRSIETEVSFVIDLDGPLISSVEFYIG